MRLAIDTGGTFTDLVVEDDDGNLRLYKAPTIPDDPVQGVLDVLALAADAAGMSSRSFLESCEMLIHGTTRATNAILTNGAARTAFLTTGGHPDILLFREGGRSNLFDWSRPYPRPYVPRSLTFQVPERVGATGEVVRPLESDAVVEIIARLRAAEVEAVAVCLLWSTVNPSHELAIGALLDAHLPDIPYTLSHRLNPTIREYRRASATAIDASLKPVMTAYLHGLTTRLRAAGLTAGNIYVVTSSGGMIDPDSMAETPILSIGSGPAMAPVAGRGYARIDSGRETVVVADAGGTTFDVSVVRRGRIPLTRETWLGDQYFGHMTGFPAIDVRSIGAGGGSLAWVDSGGLLHVGPASAGAVPGPACYGRGGTGATVTDAALVLGYIDADYFLGGAMRLDQAAATAAIASDVAEPLGVSTEEAAAAVLRLVTEHMARAIEAITVNQGIDPRAAALVGGGGAAGLNAVAIARRLGCGVVLIPEAVAALSAAGALMSDLTAEYASTLLTVTADFDFAGVNGVLAEINDRCATFVRRMAVAPEATRVDFTVEARYVGQTWEIVVPLRGRRFETDADVEQLRQDFDDTHKEIFAVNDAGAAVEVVTWRAQVSCRVRNDEADALPRLVPGSERTMQHTRRPAYFGDAGFVEAHVVFADQMDVGTRLSGPLIIESPVTTVVVDHGATVELQPTGTLVIDVGGAGETAALAADPKAGVVSR